MTEVKRREVVQLSLTYKPSYLGDDEETMTITEWDNEEGIDITISGKHEQQFSLSDNQARALQILIAHRGFV